jgi:hypothetical protein
MDRDGQKKEVIMSDADGRMIPLTEDDQGEGIKDFFDECPPEKQLNKLYNRFEALTKEKKLQEVLEKGKSDSEMLQLILDKVEKLDRKIDRIFGGYYLINGQWQKPDILLNTK